MSLNTLYRLALLSAAGVFGTLLRYWISGWVARRFGETFPSGTLAVNLAGCFAIGFLFYQLHERSLIDPALRTAIMIGLLGALTTFSSFGLQTFTLLREGEFFFAGLYVSLSNILGIGLVWIGYSLSKSLAEGSW